MRVRRNTCRAIPAALAMMTLASAGMAQALGTAFTYQGEIREGGELINGIVDLRFRAFSTATGPGQVGSTLCLDDVTVADGRFTVSLDFGAAFAGLERYLEVDVRTDTGLGCSNATGFEVLAGRQRIAPAPQALYALTSGTATNATLLNGQSSAFFQNASNLSSGVIPSARIQGNYAQAVNFTSIGNTFAGSGASLTNLNATNINSGIISVAHLPNPLNLLGTVPGDGVIFAQNSANTPFSAGVRGFANAASGFGQGVSGSAVSPDGVGVRGANVASTGTAYGVWGTTNSATGSAIRGDANAGTGEDAGGSFATLSATGYGVRAANTSASGPGYGAYITSNALNGTALYAHALNVDGTGTAARFDTNASSGTAVRAFATGSTATAGAFTATGNGGAGVRVSATGSSTRGMIIDTSGSGQTIGLEVNNISPSGSSTTGIQILQNSLSGSGIFVQTLNGGGGATAGHFIAGSGAGTAVKGSAGNSVGFNIGGDFSTASANGLAVRAVGIERGVSAEVSATTGSAVIGTATATTGNAEGGTFASAGSSARAVSGINTSASGVTTGVYGEVGSTAGSASAVRGEATSLSGTTNGGYFTNASSSGNAVRGAATSTTGLAWGGWFTTASSSGRGVRVSSSATTGTAMAGEFDAASPDAIVLQARHTASTGAAPAIEGLSASGSTDAIGVRGIVTPTTSGFAAAGVRGVNNGTNSNGYGVFGSHAGSGTGVRGSSSGLGVHGITLSSATNAYGVLGEEPSGGGGHAVYAIGTLAATGTKSFQIDHPLEPETKFLNHFCVEAPEPYNIYRGTAELDARGEADVELPAYFSAINRDPTVTLTAVGAPMPMLHLAGEVQGNRFRVAGGAPGMRVHWRVEATRDDRWMRAYGNGNPTEQIKDGNAAGKYLNPELFGKPMELRIVPAASPHEIKPIEVAPASEKEDETGGTAEGVAMK